MTEPAPKSSPLRYVRRNVFGVTQREFAEIGGLSRERLSNLERLGEDPSVQVWRKVREEASRRKLAWSDSFVFDAPCCTNGGEGCA